MFLNFKLFIREFLKNLYTSKTRKILSTETYTIYNNVNTTIVLKSIKKNKKQKTIKAFKLIFEN
ncbi:hypothetical protein CYK76_10490 [Clostridium perfringens]|uniref:Uncharacterized protein n=1 Tax=Clostridium perfringens E str. JGS1987 TaxID=451755 RepID=B1BV57_CLOPF|nr:hypothetical protein FORC3_2675 [Clostridium perfringens]EDT14431.1 hypothetical protein AC3_3077 [Clostridium perfringens E str. JGS1987]OUN50929.1 hypothetical protein B5G18_13920 [Clostridium perfringens]OUP48047.1 hypothetical protein B5F20_03500 [Clostridium perfringens]PWW94601.1 hypothetical protein CYK76_10490 [Clostridium perfringens]